MPDKNLKPISATVMVVDDSSVARRVLKETLAEQGYEVVLAPNGETALDLTREAAPDIMVLDVHMPGIDGFETYRRLKAEAATREVPILFITADNSTENVVQAFRAGGVDYLARAFCMNCSRSIAAFAPARPWTWMKRARNSRSCGLAESSGGKAAPFGCATGFTRAYSIWLGSIARALRCFMTACADADLVHQTQPRITRITQMGKGMK